MGSQDLGYVEAIDLEFNSVNTRIPVPTDLAPLALSLKHDYVQTLASNNSDQSVLGSPAALLAHFLNFVARRGPLPSVSSLLQHLWAHYDRAILNNNDIHLYATATETEESVRQDLISLYFTARQAAGNPLEKNGSALLRAQTEGRTSIYGIFGGQGNTTAHFDELRHVYMTYKPFVQDLITTIGHLLEKLSQDARVSDQFQQGLGILHWLEDPESTPSSEYLVSAPVSFPLIGLLQLSYLKAICHSLGGTPQDFATFFHGFSGHSQGVVVAAAVATAATWPEFEEAAIKATTILFWIGARSQQLFRETPLAPSRAEAFIQGGNGKPSPMLAVANIAAGELEHHMQRVNSFMSVEDKMHLALFNCSNSFVVSGPQRSLAALSDSLQSNTTASNQTRTPFSERKSSPTVRFLPITAPFHCSLLAPAVPLIEHDVRGIQINPSSLRLPVNQSSSGPDLNARSTTNLVPALIRMIATEPVQWQDAAFPSATHIVDFGPGGASGAGALTQRNSVGSGARIIVAGVLDGCAAADMGARAELFDRGEGSIRWGSCWARHRGPSLVRTAGGTFVDSKLSRLLGLPPFIIPGMTPTTTHAEFVGAAMRAGYHVEVAGGGYRDAAEMRAALTRLRDEMPAGRKIAVNVIYVNPRAVAWQIPLIRQLRAEGFPIGGLTVGGGVPSAEVASEYITTLGLEHISFKPGSVGAINQVVEIARKHPEFPVILQWTGGRGGGHHSFEDFHQPMLETYHDIRQCSNIILVAGSGFGSADDIYPYFTGKWSLDAGKRLAMPFDGFLFGSRVMTCKEAKTSPGVKAAIAAAEGLDDGHWERTLKGPAGGIISVTSEMGEPIHVVATRGALFWAEMDRTVFKLDKSKRAAALQAKKQHIIRKLNDDFQKVWFGKKATLPQPACEVGDMTYAEVLHRMVQLMFVGRQQRWIDDSYRKLLLDFLVRTEERFAPLDATVSLISDSDAVSQPLNAVETVLDACPEARTELLNTEDVHYFFQICRRQNQKPVPFVPALDQHFETWFKKDSLWQSEDLDAVPGQDAGRTFVLQGPVAVKHIQEVDESVEDVMGAINTGTIGKMLEDIYQGDEDSVPQEEYLRSSIYGPSHSISDPAHLARDGGAGLIDVKSLERTQLLSLLAGHLSSWRQAFFMHRDFVQDEKLVGNPVRRMLSAVDVDFVDIAEDSDPAHAVIRLLKDHPNGQRRVLMRFEKSGNQITTQLFSWVTGNNAPVSLTLQYEYHPGAAYAPIHEVMQGRDPRIYDFYRQLWLGESSRKTPSNPHAQDPENTVFEDTFTVDEACARCFNRAIGYDKAYRDEHISMDLGIVLSWKPVSQALLQEPVQGDLLKLVHLSNRFELTQGARPLDFGDEVRAVARVNSIVIEDSGKVVEIACQLSKDGVVVMDVVSRFLFRGTFDDFSSTFARVTEQPIAMTPVSIKEREVLRSNPWFRLTSAKTELVGAELVFRLKTYKRYQSKSVFSSLETTGEVLRRSPDGKLIQIGSVDYHASQCLGDPVTSFLLRKGKHVDETHNLSSPALMTPVCKTTVPTSNEAYSKASGDFNPIHTSPMFAAYVDLPGTITHGMYCSAAVRQVVEKYAADQSPDRVRKYTASFVGMVLPGDVLEISLHHTAMHSGLKVIKVEARNASGEKVLEASAHIAQPRTAIVFTGQGSQEKGMGMDLYQTSPVAKAIWDQADAYFDGQFGLRITDVVRNNPTEIKVHFGGIRGRILRENYMDMQYDVPASGPDGSTTTERRRMFPEINGNTASYTHRCPKGLLFATQFAQPALTITELAMFKDMESKALIPPDCCFAGHSLGEYSALAAITDFMPFERLLYIVFCRGLTMQAAVERDAQNRSSFGMVAVDPSRVSKGTYKRRPRPPTTRPNLTNTTPQPALTDEALRQLVSAIAATTTHFLEIVNFNIRAQQYVCAGDLRALDCLQRVVDDLKALSPTTPLTPATFAPLIARHAAATTTTRPAPTSIELKRGAATVPLPGVDVPFHSSWLRGRMEPFRRVLLENLERGRVEPGRLVGKYVPNVTGRPFAISKGYFEEVFAVTGSERVGEVLRGWEGDWMVRVGREREKGVAAA